MIRLQAPECDPYDDAEISAGASLKQGDEPPVSEPVAVDPLRERERLLAHLRGLGRDVFKEVTADLLQGRPSPDAITAFSQRHPDRWAQALAVAARLAGYHEKVEIDTNLYVELSQMSDVQLEGRLRALEARLAGRLALNGPQAGAVVEVPTLGTVLDIKG